MLLAPPLTGAPLVLPAGEEFGGPLARPVLARGGSPRAAVVLATLANRAASAGSLAAPAVLVGSRTLGSGVAVTRAHTPSTAVVVQKTATAGTWEQIAQNAPRYSAATGRLLVQPGITNRNGNPLGDGFVAGSPGTGPTNWAFAATGATREIIGQATINGIPGFLIRYTGNASSTAAQTITLSAAETVTAGTVVANSIFVQLVAGSMSNVTGWLLRSAGEAGNTAFTPSASMQQITNIRTLTGTSSSTLIRWNYVTNGAAVEFTLFIGVPHREHAASVAAALMAPAFGAAASAIRVPDAPTWTPSPMPARGAILLRGTVAALAGASPLGLMQLDDNTDSNRIVARVAASGGQPECLIVTGGVTTATLTPTGALAAGAEFRALVAWSPGAVRFGTSAGGLVSASVARPPGILRGLIAQANAAGTLPAGGEFLADLYDYWPSEAEALAILAA